MLYFEKQVFGGSRMDELTADSLATILKVSSVIKCNYAYEKTSSEGAAIAKTFLFGGIGFQNSKWIADDAN